jgi:hypothetical protein
MIQTYEGFRQNQKIDSEKSQKFGDFAPQEYIIFFYNNEMIFGQIKNYKIHNEPNYELKYSYYLTVDIFEVLTDNNYSWYKPGKNWNFKISNDSFKLLFKTTSRKEVDKEYDRIKTVKPYSDWELNRIAKNYNI